ncbi:hypothetical protein AB0N99_33605 [Streptomyces sp. NPDC093272]|uniref:hypothetical protein n=1 Tax=Streptomyces sp. NPDC093272 TaxID=3154981 RepID=UPI00342F93EA
MIRRENLLAGWVVVVSLSAIMTGVTHWSSKPTKSALSFAYQREGGDNQISQTLAIRNTNKESVVPVLAFTALDQNGDPLPRVHVRTVYGSDSGRLVVSYGSDFDILRFSGAGEHQVYDVRVTVRRLVAAKSRASTHPVTVQELNGAGRAVSRFTRFTAVRMTNIDPYPVTMRVAYLVYDQPAEGETQQAVSVTPIGGLVAVPGGGSTVVKVTGAAASAVARYSGGPAVSVKAYSSQ